MGRFAKPEEVGDAVCTLCDPTLSYLTGQTLILDGGLSLRICWRSMHASASARRSR